MQRLVAAGTQVLIPPDSGFRSRSVGRVVPPDLYLSCYRPRVTTTQITAAPPVLINHSHAEIPSVAAVACAPDPPHSERGMRGRRGRRWTRPCLR
jgi:hypothetical protein